MFKNQRIGQQHKIQQLSHNPPQLLLIIAGGYVILWGVILNVGIRIKNLRKTNQLNQKEFAEVLGISQGTLSDIESGKSNPSFETLQALKSKFDCDLNWLIGNEPEVCSSIFDAKLSLIEAELVSIFRELSEINKLEIIEISKIKIKLYKDNRLRE